MIRRMGMVRGTLFGALAVLAFGCSAAAPEGTSTTDEALHRSWGGGGVDAGTSGSGGDTCSDQIPHAYSCWDWKVNVGRTDDGCYVVDPDGDGPTPAFPVDCRGMDSYTPREYVPVASGGTTNVSSFVGGGACACADATVAFHEVRLDLLTMSIVASDRTFADVSGATCSCAGAPALGVGTAASCVGVGDASGRANLDLTGTPIAVAPAAAFLATGISPAGSAFVSTDGKTVDVSGGGACGGFAASGGHIPIVVSP